MTRSCCTVAAVLTALLAGCGGRDRADAEPPRTPEELAAQAAAAVTSRARDAVDPERLRDLLPDEIDGLARVDLQASRNGAMGMVFTAATGRYEGSDRRMMTVALSDLGGLGGLGPLSGAAWALSEYDRTTSTGYERTTRFEGFKAMESQSSEGGRMRAELNIIIDDRFVVQIKGRGVDVDALKAAARTIGLRRLAALG
jgi:hypothetical protein